MFTAPILSDGRMPGHQVSTGERRIPLYTAALNGTREWTRHLLLQQDTRIALRPASGLMILAIPKRSRIMGTEAFVTGSFPSAHRTTPNFLRSGKKRNDRNEQEQEEEREPGFKKQYTQHDRSGQQDKTEFPGFHRNISMSAAVIFIVSRLLPARGRQMPAGHPRPAPVRTSDHLHQVPQKRDEHRCRQR